MINKPRIALFGVDTLGGGKSGEGIPVIADLFDQLSAHYEVVYYSFTPVKKEHVPAGIKVRQIMSIRFPWQLKYLFLFIRAIADHLTRRFTLLFSVSVYPSGLFALVMSWIVRRPVIVQLIASEATHIPGVSLHDKKPWLWKLTKFVCVRADYLVAVADYQVKLARETLNTSRRIDVLPLRINPGQFIYKKRQVTYPVQFIQVAFYSAVKDQDTMFKAFAEVSQKIDCRLMLVGHGFNSPRVTAMLSELGISDRVSYEGFVGQKDLPSYYDRAHILLHTARFESGCAVIQEAMASGIGVCGTDVGLLADIGDAFAMIVPTQQPSQLAAAMMSLVMQPEIYARKTDQAYAWILSHDSAWAYQNYKNYLAEIVESLR